MPVNNHLRTALQKAIGRDEIESVAMAFPVDESQPDVPGIEISGGTGAALNAIDGVGVGGTFGQASAIGELIARRRRREEPTAPIVLALTRSRLFLLTSRRGTLRPNARDLEVIHEIPRSELEVDLEPGSAANRRVTVIDEGDGERFEYEVRPFSDETADLLHKLLAQE